MRSPPKPRARHSASPFLAQVGAGPGSDTAGDVDVGPPNGEGRLPKGMFKAHAVAREFLCRGFLQGGWGRRSLAGRHRTTGVIGPSHAVFYFSAWPPSDSPFPLHKASFAQNPFLPELQICVFPWKPFASRGAHRAPGQGAGRQRTRPQVREEDSAASAVGSLGFNVLARAAGLR